MTSAEARQTFVIVGAGMAGANAAESLRRVGFAGGVVLLGAEPHLPYERPPLSKGLLRGATPEARIFPRDAGFYHEQQIELRLGSRAVALDTSRRTVALADGEQVAFDRLLIATGGEPRRLTLPGTELPGVVYLRTLEDARALAAALRALSAGGGRVVIVGAGFIGAEVAAVCRTLGIAVTLLEILPTPLSRVLGDDVGARYADMHRAHGVDLRLGEGIAAVRGAGQVEEVETTTGAVLPCNLLLVGVGMRPADEWLRGELVRLEHFDNALRQGEAAARNMLGQRQPYATVPYFWSDQYGLTLQYVGYAHTWDRVVLRGGADDGSWAAFYLYKGWLRAALVVNRTRDLVTLKRLVAVAIAPDPDMLADEGTPLKALLPAPA